MQNTLKYKEYTATVGYSEVDKVYYGKVDGIDDLVSFEAKKEEGLQAAFIEAVDDYEEMKQKFI